MTTLLVVDPSASASASAPDPDRPASRPTTIIPPLAPIRRGRKPRANARRTAGGRYRNVAANARLPANDLAPALSPNVLAAPAVVEDPMEKGAHLLVSVNRRVDLLEGEYARGWITEAAYRVGREIQAVYEAALSMGSQGWTQGEKIDAQVAHELAVLSGVERAARVTALTRRIEAAIGIVGARRLRAHLVEGLTYSGAAAARGQSGREAVTFAAKYFRSLLEDLADAFAARGSKQRS